MKGMQGLYGYESGMDTETPGMKKKTFA